MKEITSNVQPDSALVIGCGSGQMVELLRQAGVDAFGIEQDPAQLELANPDVRPFLSQADYVSQLPERTFSLAVCLDSLSDMPEEKAEKVIRGICRLAEDIVFMETPDANSAYAPEYWAELFAAHEFYRVETFNASAEIPWLARYRRQPDVSPLALVRGYENYLKGQAERIAELQVRIGSLEKDIEKIQEENESMVSTLVSRLYHRDSHIADLEGSVGWRLLHFLRLTRIRMAPPGTRRAGFLDVIRGSLVGLREGGFRMFFRILRRELSSDALRRPQGVKSIEDINKELYTDYVRRTLPGPEELEQQRRDAAAWSYRPLISFVTPVYNPPPEALRATIESVLDQSYDQWEMCIADASPDNPEVQRLLEDYMDSDKRIRVQFLHQNLGISGNSNLAISMAAGEFIAILDHDDVLAPHMLFEVVRRIRENTRADLVYFDEDKLSEDGQERRAPFFKPDFSPEMLVSVNYLTHAVYRRSIVEEVGSFDPAFDGCQDWDLAFKVTERSEQIEHIPEVLYHWRQVSGSTAGDFKAKDYVFDRQLQCVQDHLHRMGLEKPQPVFTRPGHLKANWENERPRVSIIIPTRDNVVYLKRTIQSITSKSTYPDYEIIIVDNNSRESKTLRYFEQLRRRETAHIVEYSEPFNYSRANNLGSLVANGEVLLFLNNDMEVLHEDWLEEMVQWVLRDEIGIVGAKLLYPDKTVQHAGVVVGMEGHASHVFWGYKDYQFGPFGSADWYRNFSAITGACMMIHRGTFEEIGRFDERYILAFSDIEICLRAIKHGYRVMYTPHARLRHYEGKSRGHHIPTNDIQMGIEDFQELVKMGDPYFNPNLSYNARKPTIRAAGEEDRVSRLLRVASIARMNNFKR